MQEQSAGSPDGARQYGGYGLSNLIVLHLLVALMVVCRQAGVPSGSSDAVVLLGRQLPTTCFHKYVTGRRCSGCGMTRSVVLAFDGELAKARAMHPSGPWIAAWLVGQVIARLAVVIFSFRARLLWVADLVVSLATLWLAVYAPMIRAWPMG